MMLAVLVVMVVEEVVTMVVMVLKVVSDGGDNARPLKKVVCTTDEMKIDWKGKRRQVWVDVSK